MEDDHSVKLAGVSVEKRGQAILCDLSVGLSAGMTALLGRNGAGKTTVMRVLAGVQRPSTGVVSAGGVDIHHSPSSMAQHLTTLGWVPQGPGYPGSMRVDRFVEYAAWLKRIPARERGSASTRALASCNASVLASRSLRTLSGGERQRAILASAIVGNPRFLLLDEPTSGLDPAQRESYLHLLRGLSETTTVLYSSHLVDDVVRTASRVLVLDRGRISHDLTGAALAVPAEQLGDELRRAVILSGDRNT